ncbi:MAG: ATP-binding protein [Clostridia bacterium]|nr:ATP-binding protein [Clostridia bacterium]
MEEFSLYVLDITMNSVRAGADKIGVTLEESGDMLIFTVTDNGCGMSEETVRKISDPFFTTRKTRGVGLGIPFLKMLSEQTGGALSIESKPEAEYPDDHGTRVSASFGLHHIDFIPLGNMIDTVITLIQGYPDIDFTYDHITPRGTVHLSCPELKAVLGDDVSLASFEVLEWIRGYLTESYAEINENK